MRKSKVEPIGEVLKRYIAAFKIEDKLSEVQIIEKWQKMAGDTINSYTKEVKIYNKVLFVYTTSSVMRNELNFRKADILKRLRDEIGDYNLVDVVFR